MGLHVSQGDATEKLADQVPAQIAAAHRGVEEASGDPYEEEKDEAHKSSKGHVSEPAIGCHISLEALEQRISLAQLDMEEEEMQQLCFQSHLPNPRTKSNSHQIRSSRCYSTARDRLAQRSRPPD